MGLCHVPLNMKQLLVLLSAFVVVASHCSPDESLHSSRECLPARASSDLQRDCGDGSDKEFCGLCDFEHHSCGWNDSSSGSYHWRLQLANITSVPGEDHTTGSPWGHVMHVDGKQPVGFDSEAILKYSVNSLAALGCQLSFWYNINENGEPASGRLSVTLERETTEEPLLEILKSSTAAWENATALIGNRPGGYNVVFSFSPSPIWRTDVLLDDIAFEHCHDGDVPAGLDQLSCDFEQDTCSWYHDFTATTLWERSTGDLALGGPTHDHSTGEGYFMYLSSRKHKDPSLVAKLTSYPQPASRQICVTFWYHIFGSNIGSLKFISKRPGEAQMVVWMRNGTQGNKWRFADLTFNSEAPIQFTLEAELGGDDGSISIDDIWVSSVETGSCPAERECTFQGSLCGLRPHSSADFSWSRITGMLQPQNSSGPTADHTLGTQQGYFLSAELWRHPIGSRGAMVTAAMEPTPQRGECLMFWYYMEGAEVGELRVYIQSPDTRTLLWTRDGDQGKHWRHGRVTLLSPDATYQVVFEAVVGNAPMRDVAIDDLTVLNGACPPSGSCDFEMDFCGWVNSPPPQTGVNWDWNSATEAGPLVPSKDHTTNSQLGHFAFFLPSNTNREDTARLESEFMDAVDRACLSFWHYADGWGGNRPSKITLTVFVSETSGLRPVWSTNGYMNDTWIQDLVDYNATSRHQIILQAKHPASSTGASFSLDDIHIMPNVTCDETVPTTTPSPSTTTTAPSASPLDCSFEHGLCNWVQEVDDNSDWIRTNGLHVEHPLDGPVFDHTVGNNQGFFLLLNGSGSKQVDTAIVSVPITTLPSQVCVDFWYYMLGPSLSSLKLLLQMKSSKFLVWARQGSQNPKWTNAQVAINTSDSVTMMFSGSRSPTSQGFIAIDDITVREGACSHQDECGFDSGKCGFENDAGHVGRWGRKRGTKHNVDHTYGSENGFFMTVLRPHSAQNEIAQLLTPEFTSDTPMCLRFWYWLPEGSFNGLAVHLLQGYDLSGVLWQRSGAPSTRWEVAEVPLSSPTSFRVVFKAVSSSAATSTVQIDDVSLRDGACTPTGTCDFESGQCTWINVHKEGGREWVQANGHFGGPATDHTTQTNEGQFLLSPRQPRNSKAPSQVLSEWIQPLSDDISCLTMWYLMNGSDSGILRAYKRSDGAEERLIFNRSSSSGPGWTPFSHSVMETRPFQLLIEAESTDSGFIAIDDVSITPGPCQVNGSKGFPGCSFENCTCGWEDVSVGQFQWVRQRNASESVGLPLDNTLGANHGWYMAVEAASGPEMNPASLRSTIMQQASATCKLSFYYYMAGEGGGEVTVLLMESSRSTPLLWLSGSHGEAWHRAEVTVGRAPRRFAIQFEASRDLNKRGHVAIDDILFSDCTLPEPQAACPANAFTCKNKVCVAQNLVCDFNDDCGDGSDESSCEKLGVVERCSFEQGMCSWAKSDVDTAGGEWTLRRGRDAWPDRGPPRDHTKNNDAGYYIGPGTHLTETGQKSEMLSKTLLPSPNCTMRFFYFSLDDPTAQLTVRSRTLQSGDNDRVLWLREQSHSYSWQRAELTIASLTKSKVVLHYKQGHNGHELVAVDDISFSSQCAFDPDNEELPVTPPTSAPTTPTATPSTSPINPCQGDEFFCWRSSSKVCVSAQSQCDYRLDCPNGEDEDGCGPCTFEQDQCRWQDASNGQSGWQREKAGNQTRPPVDHTMRTGYYMRANFSQGATPGEARLQSPALPPSSPYCQMLFHFHISTTSTGSLRVLMQQAEAGEAILWSRSHNTVSRWTPEYLPAGLHNQPYKILFSGTAGAGQDAADSVVALDDISFVNCEKSFKPPALSAYGCSFEDGSCLWMQGAEDELDWQSMSGPTGTPNTGPAGDHTTGAGKYFYIDSSLQSARGKMALLKSSLLPPSGKMGYCFTFWYHMFGATVGSLRMILQTTDPFKRTVVWQRAGNQGGEWLRAQSHVTWRGVHQVILEASVAGEAGDIAIDDISFIDGACPGSDLCDFEDGNCNWLQETGNIAEWIRQSGPTLNPKTGPDSDHTTNTPHGHYYYLPSSGTDLAGQTGRMFSPLYPADRGACVQLWYHMYGRGTGTLNVYQESEEGKQALLFSQAGDQGPLWRFAQMSLLPRMRPYRIVVEGVKMGPTQEGDMAFDDVRLTTGGGCSPPGQCDFESSMCSWSNVGGGVDQGDWLRGRGDSPNPNTGPSVDHTTNSTHGYYVYVDSSVGQWGDFSFLISDVVHPTTRGHCVRFWYHMHGHHVGTLALYVNDRVTQVSGNEEGVLKWIESGDRENKWHEANVFVQHKRAFWLVFVYQRGMNPGGDVAVDDISIRLGPCYSEPVVDPPTSKGMSVGLTVGLTLLVGVFVVVVLVVLNRRRCTINKPVLLSEDTDQNSMFDMQNCNIDVAQRTGESDLSFVNKLYHPSQDAPDAEVGGSDA